MNDDIAGTIKILIIEDSAEIQEAASLIFELHMPQAKVMQSFNGGDGLVKTFSEYPDVILLDLGLPDMDGLRVLKDIRDRSNVPVIILTVRGEEIDKVRGLEMGADDYVVKPFSHQELLARMKTVLLRQKRTMQNAVAVQTEAPVAQDNVIIDVNTGMATRNGRPVKLTNTECSLLRYLASQGGKTAAENDILAAIWGEDYIDCGEYLDAYIKHLREKLEATPSNPRILLKDRQGYSLARGAI